jgi:hypothetical protein
MLLQLCVNFDELDEVFDAEVVTPYAVISNAFYWRIVQPPTLSPSPRRSVSR